MQFSRQIHEDWIECKIIRRGAEAAIDIQIDPDKVRPVEREHLQADVAKLEDLLGWVPHSSLSQGIQQLLMQEGMG